MSRRRTLIALIQVALVALLGVGIARRWFPLGIPGEWTWDRARFPVEPVGLAVSSTTVLIYGIACAIGMRFLGRRPPGLAVRAGALVGLVLLAVTTQVLVQSGAALGYGLAKWAALASPGASGYHLVARAEIEDPWEFWRGYPEWIRHQDSLHIGTHPPGLLLWSHAVDRLTINHPDLVEGVLKLTPGSILLLFPEMPHSTTRSERAALVLTGALTLLLSAVTVLPLYGLARAFLPMDVSWAVASLWPLVPSAILFQPITDTAYPFASTTALSCAVWSLKGRQLGVWAAFTSGVVLAIGMQFTLAFLALGFTVAATMMTVALSDAERQGVSPWRPLSVSYAAVAFGFLITTVLIWIVSGANPFTIWWWNQANHARFYHEFTRTYLCWVLANPIELAIGLGLPIVVLVIQGLRSGLSTSGVSWATVLTLLLLTLSGRNLGEVGRLWLPWMPALVVAAGVAIQRHRLEPRGLFWTILSLGAQTIMLQALIQVVYPS